MNNYICFVEKDYPDHFYCPISYEIFSNPVLLSDGHTYEYENISIWLKDNNKSPMTNLVLKDRTLTPNKTLENMIKEFYDNNKIKKEYYFFNNKFKFKENKNLISLDKAEIFHKKFYYKGSLKEGLKNGEGNYNLFNKYEYNGNWLEGKKNGKGKIIYKNGDIYIGEWLDDLKNGFGILKYKNGNIYQGYFLNNLKNDKLGYINYTNGNKFLGYFKNDDFYYGQMFYNNFTFYEGNFLNSKRHGKGKMIYKCSFHRFDIDPVEFMNELKKNIVDYEYNVKKIKQPNKNNWNINDNLDKMKHCYKYDGNWSNNNKDGFGEMIYVNKAKYVGNWENNLRCGKGIIYYSNQYKYDGEFKNNKREGNGKLIDNNDKVIYDGVWKDNLPCISEKLN